MDAVIAPSTVKYEREGIDPQGAIAGLVPPSDTNHSILQKAASECLHGIPEDS